MSDYRYCLLRMVNAQENNNKDYEMVQVSEHTFEARYGRVKASKMTKIYDMSVWDTIYDQKIRKGYIDVTKTVAAVTQAQSEYKEIPNEAIRQLVDELLDYANEYVKKTYKVSKQEVTPQMLKMAQKCIDELSACKETGSVQAFNAILQKLFTVIPRKMENVAAYLADDKSKFAEIILNEEKNLAVLKSVCTTVDGDEESQDGETILEHFGLTIYEADDKEIQTIKRKLTDESSGHLKKAYRIYQKDLEERHDKYTKDNGMSKKDEKFLWHGTRNECIWPIMKTGLRLNPGVRTNGKMFGYGLYFAPRAKKSLGYTSLRGSVWARGKSNTGFMFVMKVAYKNPEHVQTWSSWMGQLTESLVKRRGHDSLYAHAGTSLFNDEIIVYNEAACVPRYLLVLE